MDRNFATNVPSFTLNIDPAVEVSANGRVATVNIIATCEEGRRLQVFGTLTQGAVSGRGGQNLDCTGRLERYPITIAAQGAARFANGMAEVHAEADIRERGTVVENQEWTRRVQLTIAQK